MRWILIKWVLLAVTSLAGGPALASPVQKFVDVGGGRRLWMEYKPATSGKPTLILLNGLTWSTREWYPFASALEALDPDYGILLYDMEGMGRTLLDRAPVRWEIPLAQQVDDLRSLLREVNISGPISVAGLSYGGAVAMSFAARFPRVFDHVIAMAPFLKRLADQDHYINAMVNTHRLSFPLDPRTDTELYDFYLRNWIYATYPPAEPVLYNNPYATEAVFRMVQGAKDFEAAALARALPPGRLHLMGGVNDPYVTDKDLGGFWKSLSLNRQQSYLRLSDTQHKLPQIHPELTASWVAQILNGNPKLRPGLVWNLDPNEGVAHAGSSEIPLNKVSSCVRLIRRLWPVQ